MSCHNERLKTGGLALDAMDLARVPADAAIWEQVIRKLGPGRCRRRACRGPTPRRATALVRRSRARSIARPRSTPFPGHPSIHRLNRAEYANAVRDLLSLEVDVAALLPPDEPAYGFDNIGEMLDVSPALLERYSAAAAEIATLAVGDASDVVAGARVFRAAADHSQDQHNDGLPLGTSGGMAAQTTLPLDGEYLIKVGLFKTNLGLIRGLEFPRELEIVVDGRRVLRRDDRRHQGLRGHAAEPDGVRRRRRGAHAGAGAAQRRAARHRRHLRRRAPRSRTRGGCRRSCARRPTRRRR